MVSWLAVRLEFGMSWACVCSYFRVFGKAHPSLNQLGPDVTAAELRKHQAHLFVLGSDSTIKVWTNVRRNKVAPMGAVGESDHSFWGYGLACARGFYSLVPARHLWSSNTWATPNTPVPSPNLNGWLLVHCRTSPCISPQSPPLTPQSPT